MTRSVGALSAFVTASLLGCGPRAKAPAEAPSPSLALGEVEAPDSSGPSYVSIDVTDRYGCALGRDGTIACWGDDPAAAAGLRAPSSRWVESSTLEELPPASAVAVGERESCAVLEADGAVACWTADQSAPRRIADLVGVVELSLGSVGCARTQAGEVHCWEPGESAAALSFDRAVDIEVEDGLACALDDGGGVWRWPEEDRVLGAETRLEAQHVATVEGAVEVHPGHPSYGRLCVRTRAGQVHCGGLESSRAGPVYELEPVAELGRVARYARGHSHGCATLGDRTLRCHGSNGWAQLGDGDSAARDDAVTVQLEHAVNAHAVARKLSCALADDLVQCWGTRSVEPRELADFERHVVMADASGLVSYRNFSCASDEHGALWCWGPFGSGVFEEDPGGIVAAARPTRLALDLGPIAKLSSGCFLGRGGELRCGVLVEPDRTATRETVGSGQLEIDWDASDIEDVARGVVDCFVRRGRLSCQNRRGDRAELALSGPVTAVHRSYSSYCAIHDGGAVSCFVGYPVSPSPTVELPITTAPVRVAALGRVHSLFSRDRYSQICAVTTAGEVWCWRLEQDAAGDVVIEGLERISLPDAESAAAFAGYTCARTSTGRVGCLRDGDSSIAWLELEDVVELVGGHNHICARDSVGTVTCLGSNEIGQLGALPDGFMAEPLTIELPRLR